MSLFKYGFKSKKTQLDDNGVLPEAAPNIPPRAVKKANEAIAKINNGKGKGKRGKYAKRISPQERYDIAKYASLNGVPKAEKVYGHKRQNINTWKKKYEKVLKEIGMMHYVRTHLLISVHTIGTVHRQRTIECRIWN